MRCIVLPPSVKAKMVNSLAPNSPRTAKRLAQAESIYAVAQGSFTAVGHSLIHNIRLAGYPARALRDNPASIANQLARFSSTDLLVVCSYWRVYDVDVIAAAQAHARGATVIVIADNISPALEESADEVLLVPAEGTSFFPSLTAAMAVQQGLVATLAAWIPSAHARALLQPKTPGSSSRSCTAPCRGNDDYR
jgi:DNA-binding MurR/RpiR family transcriptional regulator